MTDIDKLYDALHNLFPIPLEFKKDLKPLIKKKSFKKIKLLVKAGQRANKAWHILNGFIVSIEGAPGKYGAVKKMYYPNEITTDLKSFFENVDCTLNLYGIDLVAQEIGKADFKTLTRYVETDVLVKRIMVKDIEKAMKRADLLTIQHEGDRVKAFLFENRAMGLPNHLAASFLAMSEENYTEEKCILIEQGFELASLDPKEDILPRELAYKCKLFLMEHFTSKRIGNTEQIAAQLFTTAKTLNRAMKKVFGRTTRDYLKKLRMEYAQELLIQKCPVNKVAQMVGYADLATFSKLYKKYFRHCPKDTPKLR